MTTHKIWLSSITCPSCGSQYESQEIEYNRDERNIDCLCGKTFYVVVKVIRSYCCVLPEPKEVP